jgi:pyruvate/2-oxoglutarate dehydrogenase complex dihydrolipoamide acyltransferase (E2) component
MLRAQLQHRRHFAAGGEFTVNVPSMGDSISEGTIVQWTKAEGDSVAQDEVIVVLETDKVSIDVRAPEAGKLTAQLAAEGDTVQVGAPLAKLDLSGGGGSGGSSKEEAPKKEKPAAPAKKEQPAPAKKESPPKQQAAEPAPKQQEEKAPAKSAAPAPAPAQAPAPGQKVEMPPIQASSPHDR